MASIKDVAQSAGVSVKTVSRILSGYQGVSEKTLNKVNEAMARLEYYPSAAAQSLRGQEVGIVSLITDRLTTTPDSFEIIAGIQDECERHGKLLMIGESGGQEASFERLVDDFRRQRAQAIIYATVFHQEINIKQSFNKCPLILVNCFESNCRHPTILPDDEHGEAQATRYLIEQGHTRIAAVTLFEDMPATTLRLKGHLAELAKAGIPHDPNLIRVGVTHESEDEFAILPHVLKELMSLPERPTAMMCGNDKMAMRVYMLLRKMGWDIPNEISVVGFDNYRMISENLVPRLTTVTLPYFRMGQLAASLAIEKSKEAQVLKVGGDIVIRESVTAPSS